MSYQKITGELMANSHPGSYCGQDAYNDMLVTERRNELCNASVRCLQGNGTSILAEDERLQRCNRPDNWGGYNVETVVRRLTPTECSRLQGFPDGWCDSGEYTDVKGKTKQTSDSAKYKALAQEYAMGEVEVMPDDEVDAICDAYNALGIDCSVSR